MADTGSSPSRSPAAAEPLGEIRLSFDAPKPTEKEPAARDISAAARIGSTLFLGADECANLEVLVQSGEAFEEHRRVSLSQAFDLPGKREEMDIEGLAVDDGWLWIVGSHSLTRKKPKGGKTLDAAAVKRLAKLKDNPNRMFLGRLPLRKLADERWDVCLAADGDRRPQMLPIGKAGSHLHRRIARDSLLAPFCSLPAKENGLDVEGIVVDGRRVALGLRGPVVNGWAVVLVQEVAPGKAAAIELKGPLEKCFLDLQGLGVRDLKRRGDDVLILAGPTLKLDGPARLFCWRDWATASRRKDRLHKPEHLFDLPCGEACDHPEALAPIAFRDDEALLVVCDSPSPRRRLGCAVVADVFPYPR